jgi:hypothetical protein
MTSHSNSSSTIPSISHPSSSSSSSSSPHISLFWSYIISGRYEKSISLIESDESLLFQRNSMGALPLHQCILLGQNDTHFPHAPIPFTSNTLGQHMRIARFIMDNYIDRDLISREYGPGLYEGENILHIAVIQKNLALWSCDWFFF